MNKYWMHEPTGQKMEVLEEYYDSVKVKWKCKDMPSKQALTKGMLYKFYIPITKAEYDSYLTLREIKMNRKANKESNDDKVNHPSHYTWLKDLCGIEVIDITRHLDFDCGNAVKYLLRAGHKEEKGYTDKDKAIEDLKKAIFYINDKIKMLQDGSEI